MIAQQPHAKTAPPIANPAIPATVSPAILGIPFPKINNRVSAAPPFAVNAITASVSPALMVDFP